MASHKGTDIEDAALASVNNDTFLLPARHRTTDTQCLSLTATCMHRPLYRPLSVSRVWRRKMETIRTITALKRWSCQEKVLPPVEEVNKIHVYDFDNTCTLTAHSSRARLRLMQDARF